MCIRDSRHGEKGKTDNPAQGIWLQRGSDPAAQRAGQRMVCLLYTSDAADERSSVDLGGRRIIKKKSHK